MEEEWRQEEGKSRNAAGMLLRLARIRQGKGQKEICHGICVVSYLSKIERGRGNAHESIIKKLFARLGIVYETDREFLEESRRQIQEYFHRLLYELAAGEVYRSLKQQEERLLYSPLAGDWLLIACLEGENQLELLESLIEGLTGSQLGYFYILKAYAVKEAKQRLRYCQMAAEILNNTYGMHHLLNAYFNAGDYNAIHYLENRVVAMALEEGNTYMLADYYYINASAYACVDMEEMMILYYSKVEHLLMNTGWKDSLLPIAYYNIGAVYVIKEKFELALSYLERSSQDNFLVWQKKGQAYLGLSDKKGVARCLEKMKEFLEKENEAEKEFVTYETGSENAGEVERLMYEELRLRCEEDYRKSPQYLEILERLVSTLRQECSFGFLYAYRNVVVEAYTSRRQYRRALEFQLEISSMISKNKL